MRCPACQEETPIGLSGCVHCGSALPARPNDDPLTARPWWDSAETRIEQQPPANETRAEEAGPRPWEPRPWTPGADDQTLIHEPGRWDQPPGEPENQTLIQEASAWQPPPGSPALPWQPGTLSAEAWPDEQPWHAEPFAPAPQAPAAGYLPPADPWSQTQGHRAERNRNNFLLATAGVIVAIAALTALGIAFWPAKKAPAHNTFAPQTAASQPSGGGSAGNASATAGSTAATQATAVNGVLDAMSNSRSEFAGAMNDAQQCANLDGAATVIQKVVGERQSELSSAQGLQVDALPSGAQLKDALTRSLQASLDADNAYLAWANANKGCSGTTPETSDYDNGNQISTDRATPAKQEFLQLWDPIAQQNNQPSRDADHI